MVDKLVEHSMTLVLENVNKSHPQKHENCKGLQSQKIIKHPRKSLLIREYICTLYIQVLFYRYNTHKI